MSTSAEEVCKYRVQFQAFDSGLAVLGRTNDLAFARQLMLAAFARFCKPGEQLLFLKTTRRSDASYECRPVYEPTVALYEAKDDRWVFVDAIGWTEDGIDA